MTIALPFPTTTYPAAHRTRPSLRTRIADLFRRPQRKPGHRAAEARITHVGITETLPVLDPEPITNPLDPAWEPFEPDRVAAHTYDELAAGTPVRLDWQPETFTETWNAAGLREQLAREDAERGAA